MPKIDRRSVIFAGLAGWLFRSSRDGIIGVEADNAVHFVGKLVTQKFLSPNSDIKAVNQSYANLCSHLFLSSKAKVTEFICPDKWRDSNGRIIEPNQPLANGTSTYGHEACVFKSAFTFLTNDMEIPHSAMEQFPDPSDQNSKVSLGSGSSNEYTKHILGTPERPNFGLPGCTLRFSIGEEKQRIKRWQYGMDVTPYVHTICDSNEKPLLRPSIGHDGYQSDDYLLVTRIPGTRENTTITIFSGLHGPATRSTELLLSGELSAKELETLANAVGLENGKVPHFQAIFRASGIKKNLTSDPTDSHVATRLELVTDKGVAPIRLP